MMSAIGPIDMPIMRLPRIQLGAVKLSGIDFFMRDKSWFDGRTPMPCVLGMDYLRHFTVDLDGRNQHMVLYARGTRIDEILGGATQGTHLDARVQERAPIWTQVVVGVVPARAQIDTGWGLATPNAALLAQIGIAKDDPRINEKQVTGKLSGKTSVIHTVELPQTQIGNLIVDKPLAALDRTTMYWIEKNGQPYLHVGWPLLSEHRLLLDLDHADIALVP
jgi:hypothetical protein